MRTVVLMAAISVLMLAFPNESVAQRLEAWASPPVGTGPRWVHDRFQPDLVARALTVSPDSGTAGGDRGERGAAIGGVTGAVVGAVFFAHVAHRNGAVNSTDATLGVAFVGGGLLGGLGAVFGFFIGSAIHR